MEASLDNNTYDETDLITLRIPLHMPYQTEDDSFERVSGEFRFEGRIYQFVKRKVSHGDLILLCLPDVQKMNINKLKTTYGNYVNDVSPSSSGKATGRTDLQKNNSCNEYESIVFGLRIPALLPAKSRIPDNTRNSLPESLKAAPVKPPRLQA